MASIPFRILSLSGGGVRGIFQAAFLKRLEQKWAKPIFQQFHLIAGTSTGSIVALAIALGIDIDRIIDLYRDKSELIFKPKLLYGFRQGPRYNQTVLRNELERIFKNKQLRDVKTNLVVTATCIDQFSHRVFSSFPAHGVDDSELSAVEVALSSSAAPTYFAPVKPSPQERSYIDGGLWANSPSLVAILYATCYLGVPINNIKLLSIGSGEFPKGALRNQFDSLRLYSLEAIQTILEIITSSQQSAADDHAMKLLGNDNFMKISPTLTEYIALDDFEKAIDKLPSLAEIEAAQKISQAIKILETPIPHQGELISSEIAYEAEIRGKFGLHSLYRERSLVDEYQILISAAKDKIWVLAIGLAGFQVDHKDKLLAKALEGVDIRLMALDPDVKVVFNEIEKSFPEWQDLCERSAAFSAKIDKSNTDIISLLNVVIQINQDINRSPITSKKTINLRYYKSFPVTMIFMIDDIMFFGPYLCHKDSLKGITFKCVSGSILYSTYLRHFEELWNDKRLTRDALA